jgi:hypothetical protein
MFHFFCEEEQKCIPFLSNMSAPTATTTPQTTNTATTPPLGANGELSLELLQEFAALLRNHRGAKVAITYQLRSHSYFVETGEWQDDIGDLMPFLQERVASYSQSPKMTWSEKRGLSSPTQTSNTPS